jgi:hypothetical protein
MNEGTKRLYTCPTCGCSDLEHDATAKWNIKTQMFELTGTQDAVFCPVCDEWQRYCETKEVKSNE